MRLINLKAQWLALFASVTFSIGSIAGCAKDGDDGSNCEGERCEQERAGEYDYIIVGSGAGGGPLAARLARAGLRVLLLEAGDDLNAKGIGEAGNLKYQIPLLHAASTEDDAQSWEYHVEHYEDPASGRSQYRKADEESPYHKDFKIMCEDLSDGSLAKAGVIDRAEQVKQSSAPIECPEGTKRKGIFYPRAGTLGGCTAHNAMITIAPKNSDWDRLAELFKADKDPAAWDSNTMKKYIDDEHLQELLTVKDFRLLFNAGGFVDGLGDLRLVNMLWSGASEFAKAVSLPGISRDRLADETTFAGLLGLLAVGDLNKSTLADKTEGVWAFPLHVRDGRRRGTREVLRETEADERLKEDGNSLLTIQLDSLVTRVLFADQAGLECEEPCTRVVGVEYRKGEKLYKATPIDARKAAESARGANEMVTDRAIAKQEVIISAGAFNTPQLLMLSGIGDRTELASVPVHEGGKPIEHRVQLAGVGKNLQDRYEVVVVTELEDEEEFSSVAQCDFGALAEILEMNSRGEMPSAKLRASDPCYREFIENWNQNEPKADFNAGGLYTTNGGLMTMIKTSIQGKVDSFLNGLREPDLHLFGVPGDFRGYYNGYAGDALGKTNVWSWVILKGHTENRGGYVKLHSTDPTDTPIINFNYFKDGEPGTIEQREAEGWQKGSLPDNPADDDLLAVVEGIKFARSIANEANDGFFAFGAGVKKGKYKEIWPGPSYRGAKTGELLDDNKWSTDYTPVHDSTLQEWIKNESWGHHASCTARMGGDKDGLAVLDSHLRVRGVEGLRVVDASVFPRIMGTFILGSVLMMSERASDIILDDHNVRTGEKRSRDCRLDGKKECQHLVGAAE